ncbi:hypothetical protein ACPA9J_02230 [Pseudomonas aeruginosa]
MDDIRGSSFRTSTACRSISATSPRSAWAAEPAPARGHRERPRSGARHGVHADRREQPEVAQAVGQRLEEINGPAQEVTAASRHTAPPGDKAVATGEEPVEGAAW